MARDYAQIMTAIWNNKEFLALTEGEQRAYLLLVTQEDINAAGVLALRARRWGTFASDSSAERLNKSLRSLEAKRFIVVDWTSEELLVRSFIRWDRGYTNEKRKPVIIRSAEAVRSERIIRTLAAEFRRVNLEGLEHVDTEPHRPSGGHPDDDGPGPGSDGSDSLFPQINRLSGSASGSEPGSAPQNDGFLGTNVSSSAATTHNPQSGHPPADAADDANELDDGFDEFWNIYPRRVKKLDARKAWRTVRRRKPRVSAERILVAATMQLAAWREEDKDLEFVPYPATWLRSGSYDDIPTRPGATVRHLHPIDSRPVQTLHDFEIDVDAILGPDHWSPRPTAQVDEMPREQRQAWFQARKAEHAAERLAEARAVLSRRRGSA